MMIVLLVAGIGFLLAGFVAIGFGIPINEFGFGNTLIVAGTMTSCTGMLLLGLWTAIKELKTIARRLASGAAAESHAKTMAQPPALGTPRDQAADVSDFPFGRDKPDLEIAGNAEPGARATAPSPPPWREEAGPRDRAQDDGLFAPATAEPTPAAKPRRNLLFSSSSRKERERAEARTSDPSAAAPYPEPAAAPPAAEPAAPPPASFEDAWPKPERSRTADLAPPRRAPRIPPTLSESSPAASSAEQYPPAVRVEDPSQVTVLKSGVVDGMAYSLYSDGSIEAQMPEGMMRFASIDELRAHLDQRP
jgi:hypothetical protein